MTTNELKKIVAAALATGTLASSAAYGIAKKNCDFVVPHKGKDICITKELKEAVESGLKANSGFGGVRFNDK